MFLNVLICFFLLCNFKYVKAEEFNPPEVSTEGAILMDAKTGTILYDKNGNTPLAPASTTKVMTALLVLEKAHLDDKVTIGKNPPNAEGTAIGIKEGEIFTVRDLLYGLLLESANDCAEALGEYVGGSQENFAKMMNEKARELGCKDTNFVNPSGLYEKGHITTPYDLALITREAAKNPVFVTMTEEIFYKIPATNLTSDIRWVNNKNNLVLKNNKYYYKECITGKTGYTTLSKHTYTGVAEKNGQRLIVSLLNCDDKNTYFKEAKDLFEYGFARFNLTKLYSKGQEIFTYAISNKETIPLLASEDFYYVKDLNSKSDASPTLSLEDKDLKNLSFKKGDVILDSNIKLEGKILGSLPMLSAVDREVSILDNAKNSVNSAVTKINSKYALGSLPAAFLLFLVVRSKIRKIKRQSRLKELGL